MSYNIIQIYYIIGWVRVLRFITFSVGSEFSGLLRYRLRCYIISKVYYVIGWDMTLSVRIYYIISGGTTLLVDSFHNHLEYYYTISWTITLSVRDYYIISWIITLSAKGILYCNVLQNFTIRKSEYPRKWNFQFFNFELPLPLNETAIHCNKLYIGQKSHSKSFLYTWNVLICRHNTKEYTLKHIQKMILNQNIWHPCLVNTNPPRPSPDIRTHPYLFF